MLRVLDLFSGIGGFSLGLERTGGFKTVQFCEIDPFCRRVLAKHWPDVPCHEDIRTLAVGFPVDVVCGGFPCQDISLAGKGAGLDGERSGLWFEMHRVIAETRPHWVIAENVSALRSRGLDQVLGSLAAIGYDAEWHCIPASAVGAPHRRDRIWIVAYPAQLHSHGGGIYAGSSGEMLGRFAESGNGSAASPVLAYPNDKGRQQRAGQGEDGARRPEPADGSAVADASGAGLSQPEQTAVLAARRWHEGRATPECGWWLSEPDVGRVAHGVPARVDRLRALGNAVVPQIPEMIGQAILTAEQQTAEAA